ncbi:T9SS type A sorting domain-containing protein [Mucilaginibacter sp. L196]|uniref:T9SS type A sorting domain-containing protein n=1 Tax=Mucilaginibacter sp. L196 TaxID=1641870 RepID=UPI00131DBDBE|nr:T9SS type A sorting domain-containing protein [Mucilaginibacter sp. L196]
MKKRSFKPGYEFIFSLCILAILGLPPLVSAQSSTKDMDITIVNGDTTVNGKNIRDLSGKDRREALKNIGNISSVKRQDVTIDAPMANNGDMMHRHKKGDSTFALQYKMRIEDKHHVEMHEYHPMESGDHDRGDRMGFDRKNTQNFIFTSTDNEGISTHVTFHVSDHFGRLDADATNHENLQMEMLDLMDLTLAPEFSSGKVLLMFNLPSKAVAEVKLKDSKGTILWIAKATNGKFSTTFAMGLNGTYYLQVKQAGKVTVKKIVKE